MSNEIKQELIVTTETLVEGLKVDGKVTLSDILAVLRLLLKYLPKETIDAQIHLWEEELKTKGAKGRIGLLALGVIRRILSIK